MGVWQLPEGIDELTGTEAIAFESVRRQLLDLYADKGLVWSFHQWLST